MNRDNIIFFTAGLLLGLILGGMVIGPKLARSRLAGAPSESVAAPAAAAAAAPAPAQATAAGGAAPMEAVRRQLDALKETLTRDPNNFEALVQLGDMYMQVGKYPQSIDYYERALRVRDDPNVRTDLGICYKESGQLEKSLATFRAAEQANPGQWQAVYNEVVVLAELRRFDEARTRFTALRQLRPDDPEVQKLGQALAK